MSKFSQRSPPITLISLLIQELFKAEQLVVKSVRKYAS